MWWVTPDSFFFTCKIDGLECMSKKLCPKLQKLCPKRTSWGHPSLILVRDSQLLRDGHLNVFSINGSNHKSGDSAYRRFLSLKWKEWLHQVLLLAPFLWDTNSTRFEQKLNGFANSITGTHWINWAGIQGKCNSAFTDAFRTLGRLLSPWDRCIILQFQSGWFVLQHADRNPWRCLAAGISCFSFFWTMGTSIHIVLTKKIQTVTYLLQHVHKRFLGHRHILGTQRRLSWHVAILLGRFLSSNFWESISISILWWWSWDNRAQLFWTAYHDIRFSPTFINSKNEICAPWFFWCSPVCLNHSGMDLFFSVGTIATKLSSGYNLFVSCT